jgi:phosphomevalonate kinase
MAVNRRALVRFEPGTPGLYCSGAVSAGDTRLFDSVLATVDAHVAEQGKFSLDTSEFLSADRDRKLGIGSSAALAVALTGATAFIADVVDPSLYEYAFTAHERLQGGKGSGVDIATSISGGLVEYRRPGREIRRLPWPEDLSMALIWTGVSTSTGSMLGKLDRGNVDFGYLAAAAEDAAIAWHSSDVSGVVEATRNYMAALADFDQGHELGITDGGHELLLREARSRSVAYKPCGAGGGDIGVVLGTERAEIDRFVARAVELGFSRLDARLDMNGLAVSGTRQ